MPHDGLNIFLFRKDSCPIRHQKSLERPKTEKGKRKMTHHTSALNSLRNIDEAQFTSIHLYLNMIRKMNHLINSSKNNNLPDVVYRETRYIHNTQIAFTF